MLICDDHAIVRQGLQTFLELQPDMEIVGQASDGEEAVARAEAQSPDVILMDLVMPRLNGIEAIKRIRERDGDAKIIVLTSFADDDQVFPAIKAGASGYLMKDVAPADIVKAIRQARAGESILHPDVARRLMSEVRGESAGGKSPELAKLIEREIEVLRLFAAGMTSSEIARHFVVSINTVKTQLKSIYSKLGAHTRSEAVARARDLSLIP